MAERTRDDALGRTVGIAGTPHRAAVPILTKVWAGPPDRARNGWHTLLANADVRGPYVLVGHSFGGLYARMYAGVSRTPSRGWCWSTPPILTSGPTPRPSSRPAWSRPPRWGLPTVRPSASVWRAWSACS